MSDNRLFRHLLRKATEGVCCNGEQISVNAATVILERFFAEVSDYFIECKDIRKKRQRSLALKGIGSIHVIPHRFKINGVSSVRKALRLRVSPDFRQRAKEVEDFVYDETELTAPGVTFTKVQKD